MDKAGLSAICTSARNTIPVISDAKKRYEMLTCVSASLLSAKDEIISENIKDRENAKLAGMSDSMLDRLTLDDGRVSALARAVLDVRDLPEVLVTESVKELSNGLTVNKIRVPLGVIAMIYEARPNVTSDAASLCLKSGNAVILRGGKEAINSNRAIVKAIRAALTPFGAENAVNLIEDTSHESVDIMMTMRGEIDLMIPRGGTSLIRHVVDNAKVPVIETGAGNCHVYVHQSADTDMAVNIIVNAKTSRPSVCNAAETLLVDRGIAEKFLPIAEKALFEHHTELRVCGECAKILPDCRRATEEDYYKEYNDYILAVKIVSDVEEAVSHINKYGTKHSEAIVSEDEKATEYFMTHVDAAALYHNASTRFTDGGVFGMGAEIGISTQKLHARGPFALEALTTVQYRIYGSGQVR